MADPERSPDRERAVAAYYDRLAPVYGEGEYFRIRRLAALAAVAAEIDGARRLLDLGCGNGAVLAELGARPSLHTAVGADLSAEMLAAARRRLGNRVGLVRALAAMLPFRAESFEVVFMSHVLPLVPDAGACAAEVARILTDGGHLIATVGFGGLSSKLSGVLSPEELADIEPVLGANLRPRAGERDPARLTSVCGDAGLRPELRAAEFSVSGMDVENWVRIRWLSIADEEARVRAERRFELVRPRLASMTFSLVEEIIVAQKPASTARPER